MGNSDFLFARPNFWGGFATAFDLGATLVEYNQSRTTEDADRRALSADWAALGDDMRHAIAASQEAPTGD